MGKMGLKGVPEMVHFRALLGSPQEYLFFIVIPQCMGLRNRPIWGLFGDLFGSCFGPPNIGSWKNLQKPDFLMSQTTHYTFSKYFSVFEGPWI